jgi:hypothetical protein
VIEISVRTSDEPGLVVIGGIGRRHRSGIITDRDGRIRIIPSRLSGNTEDRHP